jgi:glutathione S-transferase
MTMSFKLIIGNKRYSSWSLRPWMVLKEFGIPFEEEVIPLYREDSKPKLLAHSPAGKVPTLIHDGCSVWDSLAIIEYLAELFPDRPIWPRDPAARAYARSLACEMHSSFTALRSECPTNFCRQPKAISISDAACADLARIDEAWRDARALFGEGGPFLFGAFSAADAMFAPVVIRIKGYALPVSAQARAYVEAIEGLASWKEWLREGAKEEWILERYELQ